MRAREAHPVRPREGTVGPERGAIAGHRVPPCVAAKDLRSEDAPRPPPPARRRPAAKGRHLPPVSMRMKISAEAAPRKCCPTEAKRKSATASVSAAGKGSCRLAHRACRAQPPLRELAGLNLILHAYSLPHCWGECALIST